MSTKGHHNKMMAQIQKAAEDAAKGVRNRQLMREAAANMDRLSAEIRRRCGVLDIAVPYIRELRDQ